MPTSGVAFTTAYDVWSSDNAHEIMLWMNKYGAVGPLGSLQTTATSSSGGKDLVSNNVTITAT